MGSSYTWCNSKSYTFFKPLDLSRSNGQKKILINANILTNISLIISYLLHSILISKPNKKKTSNSLSLSLRLVFNPFVFPFVSVWLSTLLLHHCSRLPPEIKKKKKTNCINVLGVFCFYCEYKSLLHHFSKKKKKKTKLNCGCVWVLCFLGHHYFSS